jgi:hypothetical protein
MQKTSFLLLGQYKIYVKMTFRPVCHPCHVLLPLAIGPWQCGFAHPAEILRGPPDVDSDPKLNPPLEAMTFRRIRRSSLALFLNPNDAKTDGSLAREMTSLKEYRSELPRPPAFHFFCEHMHDGSCAAVTCSSYITWSPAPLPSRRSSRLLWQVVRQYRPCDRSL